MRETIEFVYGGINCRVWQPHRKIAGKVVWQAKAYLYNDDSKIMIDAEKYMAFYDHEQAARVAAIECAEAILKADSRITLSSSSDNQHA